MTAYPLVLADQLKRLRLSGVLESFEVRLSQARENALSHNEGLGLILQDEIQRRENQDMGERLKKAKFEQEKSVEEFDINRYLLKTQNLIRDVDRTRVG